MPTHFASPYFRVEPIGDGVYAIIATDMHWALGNAGLIDLGDEVLVFDTFASPRAAEDLRRAAEVLIGKPIGWVVNSHRHGDHFFGNQVFASTPILSTRPTLDWINQNQARLQGVTSKAIEQAENKRRDVETEADGERKAEMKQELAELERQAERYSSIQITPPQLTFDSEFLIQGSRRQVFVKTLGGGHSEGDAFLWLVDEHILFAGDLVLNHTHAWMGDGDPDTWRRILEHLRTLELTAIAPGHGAPTRNPLATARAIDALAVYHAMMVDTVQAAVHSGMSKTEVGSLAIPELYESWADSEVFGWNLTALYEKSL